MTLRGTKFAKMVLSASMLIAVPVYAVPLLPAPVMFSRLDALPSPIAANLPGPNINPLAKPNAQPLPNPTTDQLPTPKNVKKIFIPELNVYLFPYNKASYDLAYRTFLANNNVNEAFIIAFAAVKQRPNDRDWIERLAQVAIWANRPDIAMAQWYVLMTRFNQQQYLKPAIDLAEKLRAADFLQKFWAIKIRQGNLTLKELNRYVQFNLQMGNVDEALILLQNIYQKFGDRKILYRIAQLQIALGKLRDAQHNLSKMVKHGDLRESSIMLLAKLYYQEGKLKESLAVLRLIMRTPATKSPEYWQLTADLAWEMNDLSVAEIALRELAKTDTAAVNLYRLSVLIVNKEPKQAAIFAKRAWRKAPDVSLFLFLVERAAAQKNHKFMRELWRTASTKIKTEAESYPYYWNIVATAYNEQKKTEEAVTTYLRAIKKFPVNGELKVAYLSLLLSHKKYNLVGYYLNQWSAKLESQPDFASIMRTYYSAINKRWWAMAWWQREMPTQKNNPIWWYNYSEALNDVGFLREGNMVRHALWRKMAFMKVKNSNERAQLTAQLALSQAQGNVRWRLALDTIEKNTLLSKDIALSAALSQNNYPSANEIKNFTEMSSKKAPKWALLTMALHEHDRDAMSHLMLKHSKETAIRDRVVTAMTLGDYSYARYLANKGLKEDPDDALLYQLLAQIMVNNANYMRVDASWFQNGSIAGPEMQTHGRIKIENHYYFITNSRYWLTTEKDNTVIRNIPRFMMHAEVGVEHKNRKGYDELLLSSDSTWQNYFGLLWQTQYQFNQDLTLTGDLGYHQESLATTALRIAGMQNKAQLSANYRITPADSVYTQVAVEHIMDQREHFLADGYRAELAYTHRFYWTNNDIAFVPFIADNIYRPTSSLPGALNRFVPVGQTPAVGLFVPRSFYQYGLRIDWNDKWRYAYRERWRPYASAVLLRNSVTGFGYGYEFGIGGSLFGRDALQLYFSSTENTGDQNQKDITAGLNYTLYFSH